MQAIPRVTRAGFTMVEVMIALVVTGLLLSVALPAWTKIRHTSREKEAEAMLEMLANAVRQLAWDTGKWPSGSEKTDVNTEVWDLTTAAQGLLDTDGSYTGWKGPYIPDIKDDPWGNSYFFDPDYDIAGVDRIVVGSFGRNGTGPNDYDSDDIYVIIE